MFVEVIVGITSTLGEFICLDKYTRFGTTFNSAKFYANINVTKSLQTRICLKNRKGEHLQEISYDLKLVACSICKIYGHMEKDCPTRLKQQQRLHGKLNI